ncbi:OB-fold nucleic acid binding domain-containing protein [Marinactinospora rubrisoli]|uniref:OB-fold nucleic acid binding domain-containing protein n=1 Tax=Marinactinospora rubrisoli TaxID=2715399 RepID=A0ABW2KL95_9ACTN
MRGHAVRERRSIAALTVGGRPDGAVVTVGGIVSAMARKVTRKGGTWAIATVDDHAGSIQCMVFPSTRRLLPTRLAEDEIVLVKGRLDRREDVPRLTVTELIVPEPGPAGGGPVRLEIAEAAVTPESVRRMKEIFQAHPGGTEIHLRVRGRRRTVVYRLGFLVDPRPESRADRKAAVALTRPAAG